MPNFQPSGIIHIGRVPFDNSYKHTVDAFSDRSSQASFFLSLCTQSLSRSDYTYVRMNNSIRVPYNAEELYTYNYVMYQNANYGTKWFYAFIVGVNYLNENATELLLELDVMQTWWFDWTLKECFVEREHVDSDEIGEHTNPEPEMPFNLTSNGRFTDDDFVSRDVIIATNAKPHYSGGTEPDGSDPVTGGWYERVYSGAKYYAYTYEEASGGDDFPLNTLLRDLNKSGAAESVTSMFTYPKEFLPDVGSDHGVQTETAPLSKVHTTAMPSDIDGYSPRNNKLFTYPYCFARFTDNNGGCVDLKYELWERVQGAYNYSVATAIDPSAKCVVSPMGYGGVKPGNNYEHSLVFPVTAQCSWPYSAYQTWMAQNALGNAINIATNVAMLAIPAVKGLGAAAKAMDVANASAMRAIARGATPASARNAVSASFAHGFNSLGTADKLAMGAGAWGLANTAAEWSRQSSVPDVAKGQCSSNTTAQLLMQTYNIDQMTVTEEYARIIDGFFDMYGYQVDMVKKPNLDGRANWNYVKCSNSCNEGNVPAQDMALINSIFDAGITIWHTSDVGNYSLPNGIS